MSRSMCLSLVLLASILLFAGCEAAPQPAQESDSAADIQAIDALRNQFATVYNSHKSIVAAACFGDDAILMHSNQEAIEGRQAIQARLEADFKENTASIKHTPLETKVAGDWTYEPSNLAATVTPKSGKPTEESVKYLVILKRQPGGSWKVYGDISDSNLKEPA